MKVWSRRECEKNMITAIPQKQSEKTLVNRQIVNSGFIFVNYQLIQQINLNFGKMKIKNLIVLFQIWNILGNISEIQEY
jgi:hypothetical protein